MKKALSATLAALALTTTLAAPAMAGDGLKGAAMLPVKAVALTTGMVVGIPVAIARRSTTRSIDYSNKFADKIGGHEHGPPMLFAGLAAWPAGFITGSAQGLYLGSKNAWTNGTGEKPLSLDTFSLQEDVEGK